MKKNYKYLAFLIFVLFIFSCRTGRLKNLDRKPNEAIVFAKVNIKDGKENITRSAFIVFDSLGTHKARAVKPDDSSYIYLKLPLGKHFFSRIGIATADQQIPEYFFTFETPESKIYYIGDINMRFELDENWGLYIGPIGQLGYDIRDVDLPYVSVKDNFNTSKNYFLKLFPTTEEIKISIPVINKNPKKSEE